MPNTDSPKATITLFQTLAVTLLILAVYIFLQSFLLHHFAISEVGDLADTKKISTAMKSLVHDASVFSYIGILSGTLCTLLITLIIYLRNISPVDHLKLYPFKKNDLIVWLVVLILFTLLLTFTSWVFSHESSEFMQHIWESCDNVILLMMAVVIIAPIFEETLFRGFLLTGIKESALGTGAAIVFNSAIWAVIHTQYGALDIISLFLLGILFSVARIASGSLLIPIILHGTFNLFAILEMAIFS